MNNILLKILKEVGIALVVLVILAAVVILAFKDQLPYDDEVPTGEEYVKVNKNTYSVSSTDRISEIDAVTITHEANSNQIIQAENEVRIQTGKYTPFGTTNGSNDLPTERVGVTSRPSTTKENNNEESDLPDENAELDDNSEAQDNSETQDNDKLSYPAVGDEAIQKIEDDQSKSSEEMANSRFNTSD